MHECDVATVGGVQMTRPIDSFSRIRSEFDRVWIELAELRQVLNARPIAPTPDYRSDLPADEPCSCEESERLKAELGEAHVRIQELESEVERRIGSGADLLAENGRQRAQLAAANALLDRIGVWADEYGSALVPHGGSADTFGDGVRRCKRQVKAILGAHLSSQPAEPAPGCDHGAMPCSERDPFCARPHIEAHLSLQPVVPGSPTAHTLEYDHMVSRLKEVALAHGWCLLDHG